MTRPRSGKPRTSGPSGRTPPVTGDALTEQRAWLSARAAQLGRLSPDGTPAYGWATAVGREVSRRMEREKSVRGEFVRNVWSGVRKLPPEWRDLWP